MAATIATTAMLNTKILSFKSSNPLNSSKPALKSISLPSPHSLPTTKASESHNPLSATGTALAGAIFASLSCCDSAFAAQQIAEIAEGDNRGLALLLPLVPAILWVLYNILQPALNQINKMRSAKGVIVGVGIGIGSWAVSSSVFTPTASAGEISMIADASPSDSRGLLLLFVIAPAVLWVLYNILQPALNQINRMKS